MVRRFLITAAAAASSTVTRVPLPAWAHPQPSPTGLSSFVRPFSSSSTMPPSSSRATVKASRKRARPVFPEALSTVDRMKILRAQALWEDGDDKESHARPDAPTSEPLPPSTHHYATILKWLQDLVIGYKLCPWAAPALNANAIKIVVHPEDANLEVLVETAIQEASLLASMPDGPEERNLTTLIGVPGSALTDFQDFLDVAGAVDDCLDELDLRGKVQLASFHPDYRFADSTPGTDVENFTNRSPMPILHLLREVEVTRALDGYVGGDPSRIYERNKAVMREAGVEKLQRLIAACQQHAPPRPSKEDSESK